MEKKHVIFALKLFIAGVLLGILAGALGVNPLSINQEQVIPALFSIFFGLGLITATLTFYFIRKSNRPIRTIKEKKRTKRTKKTNKTILLCIVSWIMVQWLGMFPKLVCYSV